MTKFPSENFTELASNIDGDLYFDDSANHNALKTVYATDASVYQEKPIAVAIPKTVEDLKKLISFANNFGHTLIPRAAGTSLAGQVVGSGIVVDISQYFTKIIEVNKAEKWAKVQPGVIRNDLNVHLNQFGLLFGPETSTANRAMIGGMIGNNSCGLHSIIWGATRDNLLEIKVLLSDGSEALFGELNEISFNEKCKGTSLEANIYRQIKAIISDTGNQLAIVKGFPKKEITRRNTGYALDELVNMVKSFEVGGTFNLCKLIAGSEGTLCLITEAKLKLIDIPPTEVALVNVHCYSIRESLLVNLIALNNNCSASELIDKLVLDLSAENVTQSENRSFVVGEPEAILMVEFFAQNQDELNKKTANFISILRSEKLGYSYPILQNDDCKKAWELRKASLSILSNQKGDTQPVNLIEDCAVSPEDLPDYVDEVEALLKSHKLAYSITAHAGAGELHICPMMNISTKDGKDLFRKILSETAKIVKKYNGSLSGEHGDGRLRGEFIPFMMGEQIFDLFKDIKQIFDPKNVFNKGKITETPPMNEFLRVTIEKEPPKNDTIFDFTAQEGILKLAKKCSGSGDCRKTEVSGGTMCPSYMATRAEKDSTRARANMLRHFYSQENNESEINLKSDDGNLHLDKQTKQILDLCLSCKACKTECPSSVDVGKMKAEFTQAYYDKHGVPFRAKLIGNFTKMMKLASIAPWSYNLIYNNSGLRKMANKLVGFHPERTMPHLANETLRNWFFNRNYKSKSEEVSKKVYLFCDEFSNYNDVEVGKKLVLLLEKLGYEVKIPDHLESGRTYLSKGLLREAQKIAIANTDILKDLITDETPLIGIEPSAILTFRDEYLDLVASPQKADAEQIAKNSFLFEEWFSQEIAKGNIKKESFTKEKKLIKLHGHCHQKAMSSLIPSKKAMGLPENFEVQLIPSGCCGMAGSFGYEAEHYDISMKIGELVLFPTIRQQPYNVIIAASGTSCRHQILDGTGKKAKHPIEILFEALV